MCLCYVNFLSFVAKITCTLNNSCSLVCVFITCMCICICTHLWWFRRTLCICVLWYCVWTHYWQWLLALSQCLQVECITTSHAAFNCSLLEESKLFLISQLCVRCNLFTPKHVWACVHVLHTSVGINGKIYSSKQSLVYIVQIRFQFTFHCIHCVLY